MAEEKFPESYRDASYASLDAATEQKLGLPGGLLASVRENGERSNHSQSNSEKTFSVYQFTPTTRKAILDKYGLDVSLSPQNASQGAGLLLQEGLKRNGGDPAQAVGEYIGGLDRANWGKTTKSYINRVMVGLPKPAPAEESSTFDRVQASMQPAVPPDAIARVYQAYQAGQLTPEERTDFESDVKAGKVMLPKGAALGDQPVAAASNVLPQAVLNAYWDGKMSPEEKAQLQADVQSGAVKLPKGVQLEAGGTLAGSARASQIPGQDGQPVVQPAAPQPSLVDKAIGTGEAALSTATGMTGGAAGMIAGTIGGTVGAVLNGDFGTPQGARNIEQAAAQGADALTYTPRTASGRDQAEAVGSAMAQALPVMPLTGELALAGRSAAGVTPAGRVAAAAVKEKVPPAVQAIRDQAVSMTSKATQSLLGVPEEPQAAGAMGSVGAAGTDPAAIRRTTAAGLPVAMDLTTGQATRNHLQLRFEGETAKGELGQPLRENAAKQNVQLAQNFEALIDTTGAEAPNLIEAGRSVVDNGLVKAAAARKAEYRAKYIAADKAGQMEEPVSLQPLADYLNANRAGRSSAPILGTIADELGVQGVGGGSLADGTMQAGVGTLKQTEAIRKIVNKFVKDTDPNDVRVGTEIKGVIDQITEGKGGDLYKEARAARQRYAQLFENNAIVADLLRNRRGMADRQVALEDVFRRTILNGSRDDLSMLRRTLQVAGGEEGHQAWRELQGATLRHMLDEATKGVGSDIAGNPIFSAAKLQGAIRALDVGDRLGFVLGKQRAQMVRDINEIAKVVTTVPPGALNTSNTASVILAAIAEAGATGGLTGLPVPILSTIRLGAKYVRDRSIRQRVMAALGKAEKKTPKVKSPRPVSPAPDSNRAPDSRTVH